MVVAALVLGSALLVLSAEASAQQAPPVNDLPVSTERVKTALQKPTTIRLPPEPEVAHFRTEVIENDWPLETVLEALRRELAADVARKRIIPLGSPTLASVDLIPLLMKLRDTVKTALRERAERNARREVAEALAEFCSEHDCSVFEQAPPGLMPEGVRISVAPPAGSR
jgi:hypothetical protein